MKNDYFTLDGLPFVAQGNDLERRISIQAAVQVVKDYTTGQEQAEAAERAMAYLCAHVPKIEGICRQIRATYQLDDFIDREAKAAACRRALDGLQRRIENRPL